MGKLFTFISDTHVRNNKCTKLINDSLREHNANEGFCLVFSGDLMSTGYNMDEILAFLNWIKDLNYTYKVCIAGNHDRAIENLGSDYCKNVLFGQYYDNGVRYIQDEEIELDGVRIYGTPYQPYFCHWAWNVSDSDRLKMIYEQIPEGLDLLITHCPPFGILDKSNAANSYTGSKGDEPLGSKELLEVLLNMKNPPRYHSFGHIHGSGGDIVKVGETTYINASICDEAYNPTNKVITLEI